MTPDTIIFLLLFVIFFVIAGILTYLYFISKKKNEAVTQEKETLQQKLVRAEKDTNILSKQISASYERFKSITNVEVERNRIVQETHQLHQTFQDFKKKYNEEYEQKEVELRDLENNLTTLRTELSTLDETATMYSFGFYTPRYNFESSNHYKYEIDRIRGIQKNMISFKTAAVCTAEWTVNGSIREGRKQTNQTLKLILRAFNGESDAAIAKVKYNNVRVMEARIQKTYEALNKLVSVQQAYISFDYLNAKLEELYLVHEYQERLQAEKEEQRRIREQIREEEIAIREIEKALETAEREESRYAEALRKAREEVEKVVGEKQAKLFAQIEALQQKLAEAQANKQRAISRAQMTRSGYVYVISNIGSFGEDVYKIGMTRRLEPMDRVYELSGAAVPFRFDVHAIIFCEDAPTLENKLHRKFEHHRVNMMNNRKEFFRVSIEEIAEAVRELHGEIEFILLAEAKEYRQTFAFLQDNQRQTEIQRVN